MLSGTLPKDFPQWLLPKGIFPTVQFPKRQIHRYVLEAALGAIANFSQSSWPPIAACGASEVLT